MATDVKTKLLTAEEFMAADLGEGTFELVRGEVIQVPPPMPEHGRVCVNVGFALESYGTPDGLRLRLGERFRRRDRARARIPCAGRTFASTATSAGHDPRWDRRFLRSLRIWSSRSIPRAIGAGKSSRSWPSTLMQGFLWSGSSIPRAATVAIYRSADEPPDVLKQDAVIENLPELPGFRCPVADFFL